MEEKKKRGNNYTNVEKDILLELVKKYQNTIENKDTKGYMIKRKRQAWDSVCQQYNAVAVSGIRTWKQLRHLYENIKQRSKKKIAKENEISAQVYLPCTMLIKREDDNISISDEASSSINNEDNIDEHTTTSNISVTGNMPPCSVTSDKEDDEEATMVSTYQEYNKAQTSTSDSNGQVKSKKPKESNIKEQYFKAKLRNANLEYKYLINRNNMELNKYKIEMQILRLKLNKLKPVKKH